MPLLKKAFERKLDTNARKKIGFSTFSKEATNQIRILLEFSARIGVYASKSGALWWCNYPTGIDESRINSQHLERIYLSQRVRVQPSVYHEVWTRDRRKKVKKEDKLFSSHFLIHSEVMRMNKRNQVTKIPCTGKIVTCTRLWIAILANEVKCHYCASVSTISSY